MLQHQECYLNHFPRQSSLAFPRVFVDTCFNPAGNKTRQLRMIFLETKIYKKIISSHSHVSSWSGFSLFPKSFVWGYMFLVGSHRILSSEVPCFFKIHHWYSFYWKRYEETKEVTQRSSLQYNFMMYVYIVYHSIFFEILYIITTKINTSGLPYHPQKKTHTIFPNQEIVHPTIPQTYVFCCAFFDLAPVKHHWMGPQWWTLRCHWDFWDEAPAGAARDLPTIFVGTSAHCPWFFLETGKHGCFFQEKKVSNWATKKKKLLLSIILDG